METKGIERCYHGRSSTKRMRSSLYRNIIRVSPKRIIYISCNPSTQQRDAQLLANLYYLKEITPVDMFPHTTHIETVALFERKHCN